MRLACRSYSGPSCTSSSGSGSAAAAPSGAHVRTAIEGAVPREAGHGSSKASSRPGRPGAVSQPGGTPETSITRTSCPLGGAASKAAEGAASAGGPLDHGGDVELLVQEAELDIVSAACWSWATLSDGGKVSKAICAAMAGLIVV